MSSTIHSLGPKPARGLSCGLVAWVDTGGIASSTVTVRSASRLRALMDLGLRYMPPACTGVHERSLRNVAPAQDERADQAADDAVREHHDAADPVLRRVRER